MTHMLGGGAEPSRSSGVSGNRRRELGMRARMQDAGEGEPSRCEARVSMPLGQVAFEVKSCLLEEYSNVGGGWAHTEAGRYSL